VVIGFLRARPRAPVGVARYMGGSSPNVLIASWARASRLFQCRGVKRFQASTPVVANTRNATPLPLGGRPCLAAFDLSPITFHFSPFPSPRTPDFACAHNSQPTDAKATSGKP
jgi:hypothetical protein